jgi:hypothetical protein
MLPNNKFLTPEELAVAEGMAGMDDPEARMMSMRPMSNTANQMMGVQPRIHTNGRVVARTSGMEGLGAMASNMTGAYMNKQLMDKYGQVMDQSNQDRMAATRAMLSRYYPGMLRGGHSPDEIDSLYGQ